MATYDAYRATLTGGGYQMTGTESYANRSLTDVSGNTSILGDVTGDTFSVSGVKDTFRYIGSTTYPAHTNIAGRTINAFVAVDTATGRYYVFVPHNSGPPKSNPQPLAVTQPGSGSAGQWSLKSNGFGCFLEGTRLATPDGARAVETLRAGDLVTVADGRALPVRWLGRTLVSRFGADPVRALPVRIRAGALGDDRPARDLLVSPGHGILVEGVLAHAAALINGASIVQEPDVPLVFGYYHVELDEHALLLAEGAPVESFLEGTEAMDFVNLADRTPPADVKELAYPRVKSPRQLPRAAQRRLAAHATAIGGEPVTA